MSPSREVPHERALKVEKELGRHSRRGRRVPRHRENPGRARLDVESPEGQAEKQQSPEGSEKPPWLDSGL